MEAFKSKGMVAGYYEQPLLQKKNHGIYRYYFSKNIAIFHYHLYILLHFVIATYFYYLIVLGIYWNLWVVLFDLEGQGILQKQDLLSHCYTSLPQCSGLLCNIRFQSCAENLAEIRGKKSASKKVFHPIHFFIILKKNVYGLCV